MSADFTAHLPPAPLAARGPAHDTRSWLFRCLWWSVAGGSALLVASWAAALAGDQPEHGVYYFSRLFGLLALVIPSMILAGQGLAWYWLRQGSQESARSAAFAPLLGLVALAWPFIVLCALAVDPLAGRPARERVAPDHFQGGQPYQPQPARVPKST